MELQTSWARVRLYGRDDLERANAVDTERMEIAKADNFMVKSNRKRMCSSRVWRVRKMLEDQRTTRCPLYMPELAAEVCLILSLNSLLHRNHGDIHSCEESVDFKLFKIDVNKGQRHG